MAGAAVGAAARVGGAVAEGAEVVAVGLGVGAVGLVVETVQEAAVETDTWVAGGRQVWHRWRRRRQGYAGSRDTGSHGYRLARGVHRRHGDCECQAG